MISTIGRSGFSFFKGVNVAARTNLPNSGFESLLGILLRRENKTRQFAGSLYR
jgi:hypothetical protein